MRKLSIMLLVLLIVPYAIAGTICEGFLCVMIFAGMFFIKYGWILGITMIAIATILILKNQRNKKPITTVHLILVVVGILLLGVTLREVMNERLSTSYHKARAVQVAKNLHYDAYMPSYVPQGYKLSNLMVSLEDEVISLDIRKTNYSPNASGHENFFGRIFEQKSNNSDDSLCWNGYSKYEVCKKIGTLKDGTVVLADDRSNFYIKKSGTDIYIDSFRFNSLENVEIQKEVLYLMESFTIITNERLSKMVELS